MAWIEKRGRQERVYWYADPAAKVGKTYEAFASREEAQRFVRLIAALDADPEAARGFIHGRASAEQVAADAPVAQPVAGAEPMVAQGQPARREVTVAELCDLFLATKTGVQRRTVSDYRRDLPRTRRCEDATA